MRPQKLSFSNYQVVTIKQLYFFLDPEQYDQYMAWLDANPPKNVITVNNEVCETFERIQQFFRQVGISLHYSMEKINVTL